MDKTQRAKRDSYGRVSKVVADNALALVSVTDLPLEETDLNTAIANIDAASTTQATPAVGTTASDQALVLMAQTIIKYTRRALVKARRLKLDVLVNQLDKPETYYAKGAKVLLVSQAQAARKILNDSIATLGVITAANISEIDAAILAYIDAKDVPIAGQIITKSTGTDLLPTYFKSGTQAVENIIDLVRSYIGTTNIALVSTIELSAELIMSGTRHTEIDFTVEAEEDSSLLPLATVTDLTYNKVFIPNNAGIIIIPTHRPGHYSFLISCPGRASVTLAVLINRGVINEFTVKLLLVV